MSNDGQSRLRGLSPAVGVFVLVVVVVLLASVSAFGFLRMGSELSGSPPMFADTGEMSMTVTNGSLSDQNLLLEHRGGQSARVDPLELVLQMDGRTVRRDVPARGDLADGTWSAGERLAVNLTAAQVCTGADEVAVSVRWSSTDRSYVLGSETVPITTGGFHIDDGRVVPTTGYTAQAELLGTGFTYGSGGPNIDIHLRFGIGNRSYVPWSGNVNDGRNPRVHTFTNQSAGEGISVTAIADPHGTYIGRRVRSSNGSNWSVSVLRDGDTPPNIAGFGTQRNASSYVRPYLDNGTIDIADNEAIYLFELSNSRTGAAADYQDVVVLVSLSADSHTTGRTLTRNGRSVFVCPS